MCLFCNFGFVEAYFAGNLRLPFFSVKNLRLRTPEAHLSKNCGMRHSPKLRHPGATHFHDVQCSWKSLSPEKCHLLFCLLIAEFSTDTKMYLDKCTAFVAGSVVCNSIVEKIASKDNFYVNNWEFNSI